MAKTYRLGTGLKAINLAMRVLLQLGVPAPQRTSWLMTTRGRKTGENRTTPINLVEEGADRWLVSPYGAVGWVHNLRADPHLVLIRGRRRQSLIAEEVDAAESGPILKRYVNQVRITRPFFDAKKDDPVDAFVAEADRHPVFRLREG